MWIRQKTIRAQDVHQGDWLQMDGQFWPVGTVTVRELQRINNRVGGLYGAYYNYLQVVDITTVTCPQLADADPDNVNWRTWNAVTKTLRVDQPVLVRRRLSVPGLKRRRGINKSTKRNCKSVECGNPSINSTNRFTRDFTDRTSSPAGVAK